MEKKVNIIKIGIVLLFICIFLIGLININKINGDFDEDMEQTIVLYNIMDYSKAIKSEELVNFLESKGAVPISSNIERDHGVALYYIFTPFILLRNSIPHTISYVWHLYIFIIFFVSIIYFYKINKELYSRLDISVIMTLLYACSPRIFIDGLHNNKDIALMSLLVISLFYLLKIIKNNKLKDCIKFSIVSAFFCNIKIIGVFVVGIMGFFYILYNIINNNMNKKTIINIILTILLLFIIYVIITPAIWGSGKFDFVNFIIYNLKSGVRFRTVISVLFEGNMYDKLSNKLPWYYIPKLIVITLPIIITVLFFIGIITLSYHIISKLVKKEMLKENEYFIFISSVILISILLIVFVTSPNVYNGWRHFYFLYGPLLLICSFATYILLNIKKIDILLKILCMIFISLDLFYIISYGPANAAYYNFLVGKEDISKTYELDYYSVTSKQALFDFISSNKLEENFDNKIYLTGYDYNRIILMEMYNWFEEKTKEKIVIVDIDEISSYIDKGIIVYNFSNPVYNKRDMSNYELIYQFKFQNNNIVEFYKMN